MKVNFTYYLRLFTILIIATNFSCQDDILGEINNDPALIEKLYANSSDTLKIENQKLILETEIYRNLTPGGGPFNRKDRRLTAPIWIVNVDSTLITQKLSVSKLYVINNNQIWTSVPETNPENTTPDYKSFFISKGGPEWETGIYVDIVISIIDLANNNEKFIIARNQIITKVE